LGLPEVRPALERRALEQIGPVTDRVDIGPGADVIGTDLRLLNQIPSVRHLAEIKLLVEAVVRIEPADVRSREGDVALGVALGELLLVQPIDGAAGDVLNGRAGLGGELLADNIGDHVAPAAAPYADDQLVLSRGLYRRQQQTQRAECRAKPLHAAISPLSPTSRGTCRHVNNARRYPARHYSVRAWSLSRVALSRGRSGIRLPATFT